MMSQKKAEFVTALHFDSAMTAIKQTFDQIEERMATKDQLARVLEIVQSIDERLKEWQTIPGDVDRLKADVFELKLKIK
jgi:hypothetical protein